MFQSIFTLAPGEENLSKDTVVQDFLSRYSPLNLSSGLVFTRQPVLNHLSKVSYHRTPLIQTSFSRQMILRVIAIPFLQVIILSVHVTRRTISPRSMPPTEFSEEKDSVLAAAS